MPQGRRIRPRQQEWTGTRRLRRRGRRRLLVPCEGASSGTGSTRRVPARGLGCRYLGRRLVRRRSRRLRSVTDSTVCVQGEFRDNFRILADLTSKRAMYAYTASPEDPNEVSFAKGEVLDIMDASGKWWQCRNQNGQVGSKFREASAVCMLIASMTVCPSNYVQLLS